LKVPRVSSGGAVRIGGVGRTHCGESPCPDVRGECGTLHW
jgi:hypothetical protein